MAIALDHSSRPRRSPVGFYDDQLLIQDTEVAFQDIDNAGVKFSRTWRPTCRVLVENNVPMLRPDGMPFAVEVPDFDPSLLKLFLLFVFWRAAASGRPDMAAVILGPKEEELRRAILQRDCALAPDFGVVLQFLHEPDSQYMFITWGSTRLDDVLIYAAIFGGMRVVYKVDKRPWPSDFGLLALATRKQVHGLYTRFSNTREKSNLAASLRDSAARYGDPWKGKYKRT